MPSKARCEIARNALHLIVVMAPAKSPCCRTDQVIALTQFDVTAQCFREGICRCGFAEYAFSLIFRLRRLAGSPKGYRGGGVMLSGKAETEYCRATAPEKFAVGKKLE